MKPVLGKGRLTTWKDDRGFGFIQPNDGSQEVFIHISAFKDVKRRPQVGDVINYQLTVDKNGKLRACNALLEAVTSSSTAPMRFTSKAVVKTLLLAFKTLLLFLLPGLGSINLALTTGNSIPLIVYPLMSFITFTLYADDKSRAKQGRWRMPEKTLHLCEFFGGWLGAFVAQSKLHHKSSKVSYQIVFWMIVILHILFWLDWLFFGKSVINLLLGSISRR
ncbi:cold-shock DNA-binding domain protein [Nostoc sp. NIES-4103]|nr:cold-shock DNA-binding domain protein [Nostoc sp. NIES-4103]